MDKRIIPAESGFFVGKCQSCRHSIGAEAQAPGLVLVCTLDDYASTKPHWQCGRYEYEPGSLG